MKNKKYLAMAINNGEVVMSHIGRIEASIKNKLLLPDGCCGIMFVFNTKTAARKWYGKNIGLQEIKLIED